MNRLPNFPRLTSAKPTAHRCRRLGVTAALLLASAFLQPSCPLPVNASAPLSDVPRSPEPLGLAPAGQFGGATYAAAVRGSRAYAGVGPRLVVLALDHLDAPVAVGQSEPLGGLVRFVRLDRQFAYVVTQADSPWSDRFALEVVNLGNRDRPRRMGRLDLDGVPSALAVYWPRAVIASSSGVYAIDLTLPEGPVRSTRMELVATDVAIDSRFAYVAAGHGGLFVLDLNNDGRPSFVGRLGDGFATGIAIENGRAYIVSQSENLLRILDIRDLDNIRPVTSLSVGLLEPTRVGIQGTEVWLYGPWGAQFVALRQPDHLELQGLYPLADGPAGAPFIVGSVAYVPAGDGGLQLVDLRWPGDPRRFGVAPTVPQVLDLAMRGNLAYVASGGGGVWVLDIAQPEAPRVLGHVDLPDARALAIDGDRLYVAAGREGLLVLDLSQPASPAAMGRLKFSDEATEVAASGSLVLVGAARSGARLADVADLLHPRFVAAFDLSELPRAVAMQGTLAVVAAGSAGLVLFDLSQTAAPRELARIRTPDNAQAAVIRGNRLFATFEPTGVRIYDLTVPDRPRQIAAADVMGADRIGIEGATAFVSTPASGLFSLRIADDATDLTYGARFPLADVPLKLWPTATHLWVTTRSDGLWLFRRHTGASIYVPFVGS